MRRLSLFVVTNLLIVLSITTTLRLLGVGQYLAGAGLNPDYLIALCVFWGFSGSVIALALSKVIAKLTYRIGTLTPGTQGDWVLEEVRLMSVKLRIKTPEVGIYQSEEMNAFATGPTRNNALIAFSTGLLERLNKDEIRAVIAHELTHVANGDMVTMTLIQGTVNSFVLIAARICSFLLSGSKDSKVASPILTFVFEVAFGLFGLVIVCWFSRLREYRADKGSAQLVGRTNMVSALLRISGQSQAAHDGEMLASSKLFGSNAGAKLFATHPSIEQRVKRLKEM